MRPIEVRGCERYYLLRDVLDAIGNDFPSAVAPSPYDQVELLETNLEGPMITRTWDQIREMLEVEDTEVHRGPLRLPHC